MKKVGKKSAKLTEDGLAAGLQAISLLNTEGYTRPVVPTAKTLVEQAIVNIVGARRRGVPLVRIYEDTRKAAGLQVSYKTFASYVSIVAKEKCISLRLKPKRPPSETGFGFICSKCLSATRHESTEAPGSFFWRCDSCKTCYCDSDRGQLSAKQIRGGQSNESDTAREIPDCNT
jgi:hypothetical protein